MIHNVFVGNPGSGKSTIANTIIGTFAFPAGLSFGVRLTTTLSTHKHNGESFTDTPGLDDVGLRDQVIKKISAALSQNERLRLIFVCTLEDGRVRSADVDAMDAILDAICKVGILVQTEFSLIINKCSETFLKRLKTNGKSREEISTMFAKERKLEHVYFAPKDLNAEKTSDVLHSAQHELRSFLQSAPVLQMLRCPATIDTTPFHAQLDREILCVAELRRELERMVKGKMIQSDGRGRGRIDFAGMFSFKDPNSASFVVGVITSLVFLWCFLIPIVLFVSGASLQLPKNWCEGPWYK